LAPVAEVPLKRSSSVEDGRFFHIGRIPAAAFPVGATTPTVNKKVSEKAKPE
jgi:hypothetical protein